MDRQEAITVLKKLERYFEDLIKAEPAFLDIEQANDDLEAIRYGRNSLEVDEQYQIEYENPYMTFDEKGNAYINGFNIMGIKGIKKGEVREIDVIPLSVIEDIKAYIDMTINLYTLDTEYNKAYKEGLKDALGIIDKHISEKDNDYE